MYVIPYVTSPNLQLNRLTTVATIIVQKSRRQDLGRLGHTLPVIGRERAQVLELDARRVLVAHEVGNALDDFCRCRAVWETRQDRSGSMVQQYEECV